MKVGNNRIGLIGIHWQIYICKFTPPWIETDNLRYDDFLIIISVMLPVALPVMLPELYNEYYLNTIEIPNETMTFS